MIGEVDDPLWRLRDVQFLSIENSQKAWQLIAQVESRLGQILQREQQRGSGSLSCRPEGSMPCCRPR